MDRESSEGPSPGQWPTTAWELVHRARESSGALRARALDDLFRLYHRPIEQFFARALRIQKDHVDDVAQEFFVRFIDKDFLKSVTYEKSFRGFLKVACRRHYLKWREAQSSRRDDDGAALSPEETSEMVDEEFRRWYVAEAVRRVGEELHRQGKPDVFAVFEARTRFEGRKPESYESLAERFGKGVYDIRNHLTAARKIFRRELLNLATERAEHPTEELAELGLLEFIS